MPGAPVRAWAHDDDGRTTTTTTTDACAETVFGWILGMEQTTALYLGDRLGWYRSLAEDGPATAGELAARTGTAARYAREWLEHQAVSGMLTVDDPAAAADERRFAMPAAHVPGARRPRQRGRAHPVRPHPRRVACAGSTTCSTPTAPAAA